MSAKEISEIVKNWVTSITLLAGLIITAFKGPSYIAAKEREIKLKNTTLSAKLLSSKIKSINELEVTISKKTDIKQQENSKPFNQIDMGKSDHLDLEIHKLKTEQLKLLNEIKVILEGSLD